MPPAVYLFNIGSKLFYQCLLMFISSIQGASYSISASCFLSLQYRDQTILPVPPAVHLFNTGSKLFYQCLLLFISSIQGASYSTSASCFLSIQYREQAILPAPPIAVYLINIGSKLFYQLLLLRFIYSK